MAGPLTDAQIRAKAQLQRIIATAVATAWRQLPHYNQEQLDQWLSTVIPLTAAANQQSVMLTEAFLAQALNRPATPVDAAGIVAGIRNGITPDVVFKRPFVTVWTALKNGTGWNQAVRMGEDRAVSAAVTDVQLSFTHALRSIGNSDNRIVGYVRVPDPGACDFCKAAAGQVYHTDQLLPLHTWCGCGVDPATGGDLSLYPAARSRFAGPGGLEVAVHQHGELGPVLTNASDHFAGPAAVGAN